MNIKQQGFTLVELMVTVAVVIILSIIAIPSWTALIRNNSMSIAVNQVQNIYQLARSEAVKRHEKITLESNENRLTWTLSDGDDNIIKKITLSTDQVTITPSTVVDNKIKTTIDNAGFTNTEKIAFSWEDEYRCLIVYSSGQSNISEGSGDCS